MISNCPHCRVALKFNPQQRAQLEQALNALQPGKHLTIKCPQCRKKIPVNDTSPAEPTDAGIVKPPTPPDLEWLRTGRFEEEEKVEDVPMALVLHADPIAMKQVQAAMESVGYRVLTSETAEDAIEQMHFISFACVAYHVGFEPGGLENSLFHGYMRQLAMERRRYIFYILFGPQFHSLYDMEALAFSANMVVAEHDLKHFDIMLRKAIPAYEELFGPILEELGSYGKR